MLLLLELLVLAHCKLQHNLIAPRRAQLLLQHTKHQPRY
jgi:hypothetical protein